METLKTKDSILKIQSKKILQHLMLFFSIKNAWLFYIYWLAVFYNGFAYASDLDPYFLVHNVYIHMSHIIAGLMILYSLHLTYKAYRNQTIQLLKIYGVHFILVVCMTQFVNDSGMFWVWALRSD